MRRVTTPPAGHRQRGAVIVETALILPLLLLILLGLAEFGLAWHADNSLASVMRSGIIEHARDSSDRDSDLELVARIQDAVDDPESIAWIMVYRTRDASADPTGACTKLAETLIAEAGGVDGSCVIYPSALITARDWSRFDDPACAGDPDQAFCPTTRATEFGPDDRLGIAVVYRHQWLTGFFPGDGISFHDRAVSPLLTSLEDL